MRLKPLNLIVAVLTSSVVAQYLVLFYNHWYFAGTYWPRWLALSLVLLPVYLWLLRSRWEKVWLGLGIYWTLLAAGFMVSAGTYDLSQLGFTSVLNLEAPMIWLPVALVMLIAIFELSIRERSAGTASQSERRALQLRRRLRRRLSRGMVTMRGGAAVMSMPLELRDEVDEHHRNEVIEFNGGGVDSEQE